MAANPRLSVRAFAELLGLPAVQQLRVLNDQKYPKSEPQSFKVPYYQPAVRGIRAFYRGGNDPAALAAARAVAEGLNPAARRQHNLRVLDEFESGPQSVRSLSPITSSRYSALAAGVEVRLQFDLTAVEKSKTRHILYNLRGVPLDADTARLTLEIAYWVMAESGIVVPIKSLEHVDISTGVSRCISQLRKQTIKNVEQNAKVIQALWVTI